ncbi:MAG: hypothetical protein OXI73_15515 [Rhodospirillales bacterium]|nr:hypothetical protein [Rhodospirillales bacterium]MCY4097835.1 hypothetical protein [Rhodospirillales bacterium]MDE0373934.1 hypothetical protein [Rhodospirillales bacterium]
MSAAATQRRAGLAVPGQAGGRSVARDFRRCLPGCRLVRHPIFGLGAGLERVLLDASVVVRVAMLGGNGALTIPTFG